MSIIIDKEKKLFTLHTKDTTYQMKVDEYGYLLHLYYGKRIQGNMEYLILKKDRGFSGNPYEALRDRNIYPESRDNNLHIIRKNDTEEAQLIANVGTKKFSVLHNGVEISFCD